MTWLIAGIGVMLVYLLIDTVNAIRKATEKLGLVLHALQELKRLEAIEANTADARHALNTANERIRGIDLYLRSGDP